MVVAEVILWGRTIGAVSWDDDKQVAVFEYAEDFANSDIQIAPFTMPLAKNKEYTFPALNKESFYGLPGLLADSLPDKFGNALINAWLAKQGRDVDSFTPIERLCYVGNRGMGALEFRPSVGTRAVKSKSVNVNLLADLASEVLTDREAFKTSLNDKHREESIREILRVGTSAGGARAKALIAFNTKTKEVRSGQIDNDADFSYWILKFDGVSNNRDKELVDPQGYGLIEYAYYKMAIQAGINMSESQLLKEGGRAHFITKRFDRTDSGEKLHMSSLAALRHYDFNQAGAHSYEEAFRTIQDLGLPYEAIEEQYRRMVFNIMARNQDDHVKNIAFLMNKEGQWSLSPAYDLTYSYNPEGDWTSNHQMSMNLKRSGFVREDFLECADTISFGRKRANEIIEEVITAIKKWPELAKAVGVKSNIIQDIKTNQRIL